MSLLKVMIFIFVNLEKVPVCRTGAFHYKKALYIMKVDVITDEDFRMNIGFFWTKLANFSYSLFPQVFSFSVFILVFYYV